jgi:hypothetical protein
MGTNAGTISVQASARRSPARFGRRSPAAACLSKRRAWGGLAARILVGTFLALPAFAFEDLSPNSEFDTDVVPWIAGANSSSVGWASDDHG